MRALIIHLLFYPTLAWNLLLCRLIPSRRWWDKIDDDLFLGALPSSSTARELHAAGVRGVVNTCAEYSGPEAEYERLGITQLLVPTLDFTPPRLEDVESAVAFISECADGGEPVYVHCKAGRARSATVALCWLVAARGMTPAEAQLLLVEKRPHVNPRVEHREVVKEFCRRLERSGARDDHSPK